MTSLINKFRAARFRQAAGGDVDVDVLLPPPLPLIKLPDEPQLARSGAMEGRPMHLPVRRHLHCDQRNLPPEPNLQENRASLAAQSEQDTARPILQRIHVYQYNQPQVYQQCGAPEDTLVFDSLFEGGNLQRAERVIREADASSSKRNQQSSPPRHEYELLIHPDVKNSAYRQWFYFEVRNGRPGVAYTFSLVNLAKSGALFGYGLQPCVYSEIDAETRQRGWVHAGTHVQYELSNSPLSPPGTNALSFQYTFAHENDRVYFACLQPYTYTDLVEYLDKLERDPLRSVFVRRLELCQTIAQNACEMLSITSSSKSDGQPPPEDKKIIVISARVHPGEPNASWMMKGMLDYLTGPSSGAAVLRKHFVFKVVPMLNPDGVINGNTRVNLAGWDLNRKWAAPVEKLFPTVYHLKKLLANWQTRDRVAIYCDLHGHSISRNIFTYGCYNKRTAARKPTAAALTAAVDSVKNDPRVFPMIVAKNSEFFSFASCDFKVHKSKLNTARVVVNHELGVINSYTLEASFCGPDFGPRKDTQFSTWDLEDMGRAWCQSLLIYFDLLPHVRAMDKRVSEPERLPAASPLPLQSSDSAGSGAETVASPGSPNPLDSLTILTPDAALLELNADILSDCEAAISELFATVDLLDDGGGNGGNSSGDSDLSGAEEPIPPSDGGLDQATAVASVVITPRKSTPNNGYSSAPESESMLRSGIVKKLRRRASSIRRKKAKAEAAEAETVEAEAAKAPKKSKKKKKSRRQEKELEAEDAQEPRKASKRRKGKHPRHRRFVEQRSQSFRATKPPEDSDSRETGSGRMADLVLPEVPGSGANRQQKTPPLPGQASGDERTRSLSFTRRASKLVRIGSGHPLELPLVKPVVVAVPVDKRSDQDDGEQDDDDSGDDEEEDGSTSESSDASEPGSVVSEF